MDPIPIDKSNPVFSLLIQRAQANHTPLGVHIDITYKCDLKCVHCFLTDRTDPGLPYKTYERILHELKAAGTLFLLMSGGDIFVHPKGIEMIELARKLRFETRIITHGGHITEEIADRLAKAKVSAVGMSLYSADPSVHDRITKRSGSHARTIAATKRLQERKVPVLLKCVIMKQNGNVVAEMQQLARELKVSLEFARTVKGDDAGDDSLRSLNLTTKERAEITRKTIPEITSAFQGKGAKISDYTCMAGNASCYIAPNGDVKPCAEWDEIGGNLHNDSFKQIWYYSPLFRRTRRIRREHFTECSNCKHYSFCSLCPARALRDTGKTTGKSHTKCEEINIQWIASKL